MELLGLEMKQLFEKYSVESSARSICSFTIFSSASCTPQAGEMSLARPSSLVPAETVHRKQKPVRLVAETFIAWVPHLPMQSVDHLELLYFLNDQASANATAAGLDCTKHLHQSLPVTALCGRGQTC